MPRRELTALRGRDIGMIFQQPEASLDPVMRVGRQIAARPRGAVLARGPR